MVGFFQLVGRGYYLGIGAWEANRTIGWGWDIEYVIWRWLLATPATCAMVSALIYGWLHYRRRHLTLWAMALQMVLLLILSYVQVSMGVLLPAAWLLLIFIIIRSRPAADQRKRSDILDDV